MTKKKHEVEEQDYDSDMEFDDFDMDFPALDDDREPVSKPGKAFAKGVKSGLSDTTVIKNMFRKNLPTEYGDAFDMIDEVAGGARDFSKEVVKQAKPAIADLANAADKFLPNSFKSTKNKLNKIREWAEKDENASRGPSKEQQREDGLGIELGRIFSHQQKVEEVNIKIDKQERALDRGIDMAQHKDILAVLIKLTNSTLQNTNYTTTINSAWQRKSLESQYRTLFAIQDLLEETKKSNASVISNLTSITKNSALPDYRKTQRDEAFMDEARKRFSGRIVDASSGFFKRGLQKMRSDVGTAFSDLASVTSMLSIAGDMSQMSDEFDPKTLEEKLAGGAGGAVGKWLQSKAGGKLIAAAKKNPKILEFIAKGQNTIASFKNDKEGLFEEYSDRLSEKDGLTGALASYFKDTFKLQQQNNSLDKYDSKKMYDVGPFTNKVSHSITDVIPGYLARILQEQSMTRTGKKAELIKFDYRSGKFDKTSNIINSIKKSVSEEELATNSDYYFKDIMAAIEDKVDLTEKERSDIANALLKKGVSGESLNPEKMTDADHWRNHLTESATADKMAEAMKGVFGTESDKEFYGFGGDVQGKAYANEFVKNVKKLNYLRKNLKDKAQYLIDNGMMDEAEAGGLLKNGELNIDLIDKNTTKLKTSFKGKGKAAPDIQQDIADADIDYDGHDKGIVQKLFDLVAKAFKTEEGEGRTGTSDEDTKENKTTAGEVLGPISRLPIMKWNYKIGHEDNGATTNIGPMAQDLQKELGDDVAPGGKKIDLVNASGIAMKAIQELNTKIGGVADKVKGFIKGDEEVKEEKSESSYLPQSGLECLRGIYYNTNLIANQGAAMINISSESLKSIALGLGTQLGKIDFGAMGTAAQEQYNNAAKFVKENNATSILGRLGDAITDIGGSVLGTGFTNAGKAISSTYRAAKRVGNFLQGEAGGVFANAKLQALETFDVYVKGEEEPRMLALKVKLKKYLDFDKQTPIRTRKDIKAIETGIIEVMEDGSTEFVLLKSDLENTYFVNTHKTAIEKAIRGSGKFLFDNAKAVVDSFIKPAFAAGASIMTGAKNLVNKLADNPVDIFVKNKLDAPVLTARRMRKGFYIDFKSSDVIKRPGDIKGIVFDTDKNEIALTQEEFDEGLVDIKNRPLESVKLRFAMGALGVAVGAGASIMSWTAKKLAAAPGMLGRLANKGGKLIGGIADKLGIPDFNIGGFFGAETVDILKDIRYILQSKFNVTDLPKHPKDVKKAAKAAQTEAGKQEFKKSEAANDPVIDKGKGKKKQEAANDPVIKPISSKPALAAVPAAFTIKPAANDSNVNDPKPDDRNIPTEVVASKGNALTSMLGMGAGAVSTIASFLKKPKATDGVEADPSSAVETPKEESRLDKMVKSVKELTTKLTNKDDATEKKKKSKKVMGPDGKQITEDGFKVGSWQERAKNNINVNKEKALEKAKVKVYETKNIFSMVAETLKKKFGDWFGKKTEATSLLSDIKNILLAQSGGDNGGIGDIGGSDEHQERRRNRRDRVDRGRAGQRRGGRMQRARDFFRRNPNPSPGPSPTGGSRIGSALRFGGKALGAAGVAYGAYSAYDNFQKGEYGSAAVDAGLAAVGAGVTFAGAGATIGAVGTGLGMAGTAAMAVGSTALAVLSSPVFLTALAVGAVGYGGYKAFKYLTRKEFNPTEKMRMLEYGLRGGDETQMRTIYELEEYIESVSKTTDESFTIDASKLDEKKLLDIFDVDKDDQGRYNAFINWLNYRFKPIFGKWKVLAKQIGASDKIKWFEKADNAKLLDVFKAFKSSVDAYKVKDSPFSDIKINTDASVIENFKREWLTSIKDTAAKAKDEKTGKDAAATGAAIVAGAAIGKSTEEVLASNSPAGTFMVDGENRSINSAKKLISVDIINDVLTIGSKVSALEAIKWRAYGVSVLGLDRIKAIRNLEAIIEENVKINSQGRATFDGDALDILKRAGGYFGISDSSNSFASTWLIWFKNRFLPVFLTIHSTIFSFTKRNDIKNSYRFLEVAKASESLVIARSIVGCPGIWSVKEFAFPNMDSNMDPKTCEDNLMFLEKAASEETAIEDKASKASITPPAAIKNKSSPTGLDILEKPVDKPVDKTVVNDPVKQSSSAAAAIGLDEVEDKTYTDGSKSGKVQAGTIASGSVSSLAGASGDLASGAGAMAHLTLADKANINGLHPSIKRLFLGMVEEFGQTTGEKIQVNRAYSSPDEQAALFNKLGPSKAAKPGTSLHEFGLAIDVNSKDLNKLEKLGLLRKYGFTRPLGSEPWHLEPAGIFDNATRQKAKKDHGFATKFIESGIGRGGGGLGSRGLTGALRRDDNYAKRLFDATTEPIKNKEEAKDSTPPSPVVDMAKEMTGKGVSVDSTTPVMQGIGDSESKEGRVPSAAGAGNATTNAIKESTTAANDELMKTSYDLTSGVKGTVGGYDSLPESTGKGWSGNGLLIKEAAKIVGLDPALAAVIAAKESSLNPNAKGKNDAKGNSVAQGMYQFMPGTWDDMMKKHAKKYGIKPGTTALDARANTLLGLEYIKQSLNKSDGSNADAYMGHMLGPGGANKFRSLKGTDIPAKALPGAANNNTNVFFNSGDKSNPKTKTELLESIDGSLNKQLADFKIPLKLQSKTTPKDEKATTPNDVSDSVTVETKPNKLDLAVKNDKIDKLNTSPVQEAVVKKEPAPSAVQTSMASMLNAAPVRSQARVSPVMENNNNGIAKLEKITNEQLVENRKTNDLLVDIRNILSKGFDSANKSSQEASANKPQATTNDYNLNRNAEPTALPNSYVQRARA